ncbi:MAG: hypothetical protein LBV18_04530 [Alistipes sp.]|jgi:hypothetical protein|nr:hypothetical protein [Alistipes sp.]
MRRLFYLLATLPIAIFAAGCGEPEKPTPGTGNEGEEEETIENTLSVSTEQITFKFDEMRVDRNVQFETDAEQFDAKLTYDDPENADWLDMAAGAGLIKVAALSRNVDLEEQPRTATITITAGSEEKTVKVTQESYVETDFSILMMEPRLSFAAEGSTLSKENVAQTNGKTIEATGDKPWITNIQIDRYAMLVTVAPNEDAAARTGTVTVTNERGGETTFEVYQYGKPDLDISGTWNIQYLSAPDNNAESWLPGGGLYTWNGTLDIEMIDGGYALIGMYGSGMLMTDLIAADPSLAERISLRIRQDGDKLFVGMSNGTPTVPGGNIMLDPAFTAGGTEYYSGKMIHYETTDTPIYTADDFEIITFTEEVNGVINEVMAFPTEYTNNPDPMVAGQTGIITYTYYSFRAGRFGVVTYTPVDFMRNVVLYRAITE